MPSQRLAATRPSGTAPHAKNRPPGDARAAADALKRINARKRAARPPRTGTADGAPVEYLYEPRTWDDYRDRSIRQIPVAKMTAKRIYFDATDSYDRAEGVHTLRYISREEFEARHPVPRC